MDLFAIRNGLISKSNSMDPKNAPQPFQAPIPNERLPPFSSVVLLSVWEIPQRDSLTSSLKQRPVFSTRGRCQCWKMLKVADLTWTIGLFGIGIIANVFFWKHRDYMETYLNILAPTLHKHPDIENDIKGHENRQYQFNINQNHKIQSKFPKISWTKCFHFFFVSESSELWKIGLMPRALTHPIGRRMSPENIQLQRNHAHWTLIYFDVISSTKIPWGRSLCEVTVHFFGDKNDG